jgi:transposase-like protein
MAAEIDQLRKQLRRGERINEILKKTVSYFAKDEQ